MPDRIPASTRCDEPVSGVDILPTVCELVGITPPGDRVLDGQSLIPLLTARSKDFVRKKPLYWFFYRLNPSFALRHGKWSVIASSNDSARPKSHALVRDDMSYIKQSAPERCQLFDLELDLAQSEDLGDQHPGVLEKMRSALNSIHASVLEDGPSWDIPSDYHSNSKRRIWNSQ